MASRILSLATDSAILTLREMILQAAGYKVRSVTKGMVIDSFRNLVI